MIWERVRAFLAAMPWKKILAFSFFVFLSAVLWFMQIYRQNFQATYHLPVKYVAVPDSIVFETNLPSFVDITIEDTGYALFRYFLIRNNDSIVVNVDDIIKFSSSSVLQGSLFEQILRDRLLPTSQIVSYNPNRISFYYSVLQQKKIPVILDGQIYLAAGYLLNGDIYTVPDSVMAYGAKDVLVNLNYAYTVSDTVSNIKSGEPVRYAIKNIQNVRFTPEVVDVVVPVDKYTQKDVIVPVECINLPENLNVRFFPSNVRISFLVALSRYAMVNDSAFSIQLDYNRLKNIGSSVAVNVTSYPDYVQNIVLSPSEVEFIFEQK